MRMFDADAEGADWSEARGSCYASIRSASLIERGRLSRAILRALINGWHGMDTGTCFDGAGLVECFATDPAYRQRCAD
jgi:hypothetical protein